MRSWTATRPREATVRGRGGTASASASATTMTGSGWTWTHPRGAPPCPSCGSGAMHAIVVVKQRMHIRFGGACTAAMAAATKNCALSEEWTSTLLAQIFALSILREFGLDLGFVCLFVCLLTLELPERKLKGEGYFVSRVESINLT